VWEDQFCWRDVVPVVSRQQAAPPTINHLAVVPGTGFRLIPRPDYVRDSAIESAGGFAGNRLSWTTCKSLISNTCGSGPGRDERRTGNACRGQVQETGSPISRLVAIGRTNPWRRFALIMTVGLPARPVLRLVLLPERSASVTHQDQGMRLDARLRPWQLGCPRKTTVPDDVQVVRTDLKASCSPPPLLSARHRGASTINRRWKAVPVPIRYLGSVANPFRGLPARRELIRRLSLRRRPPASKACGRPLAPACARPSSWPP